MREFDIRLEELAPAVAATFVFLLGVELAGEEIPLLRPVVGLFLFGFFPGAVLLATLGIEPRDGRKRILYAVGVSLVVVMGVGLILNLVLPAFGIDRPLSTGPLLVPYLFGIVGLCGWRLFVGESSSYRVRVPTRLQEFHAWQLVALLLPLLSVITVSVLNVERQPLPVIVFLILLAVVPVVAATRDVETHDLSFLVWGLALAVLWHKSLWVEFTYGGHVSVVSIFESGYWNVAGETLLVNAVLMPELAHLLGVEILTHMKVVMPFIVSFIPVGLYVMFERYTSTKAAFIGAGLFVFAHPFYFQYPSTPRASIPVLFLTLIGVVITDDRTDLVHQRTLSMLFGGGLAVSHYGTSYYVMFGVIGAVGLLYGFKWLDIGLNRIGERDSLSSDGGNKRTGERGIISTVNELPGYDVIQPRFMTVYITSVVSWYLYVDGGSKFVSLTVRIIAAYGDIFLNREGYGATATRVATDYGSDSIALSKYIYVLIAALVGLGMTISYYRRFFTRGGARFDDEYLAMAALLLFLFSGTFILSGQWGGGRPAMVVLSFCAIFPVVAVVWMGDVLERGLQTLTGRIGITQDESTTEAVRMGAMISFAVLLAVFFVLNSGVMAALVFEGEAPSNVPSADPDSRYLHTDIQTHAWLADHRDDNYQIYGDRAARGQTTDWMNGEIAARADRDPYRFKEKFHFSALDSPEVESGYVILLGHNIKEGRVEVNYITQRSMTAYNLTLDERGKVYTSGSGEVYYHPQ